MDLNIVNLIHIGDRVVNQDDLSPEELREIRIGLNIQALTPLGYVPVLPDDKMKNDNFKKRK